MPKRSRREAKAVRKTERYRHDPAKPRRGRTDFARLRQMTDAEIDRQIAADPDVAPEIDDSWMADAELLVPQTKQAISFRVDRDVLDYFKEQGGGYQTRMNAVLRAYVKAKRAV